MPNTDFPKYLGLAGLLTDDNDDLNNDIIDGVTSLKSGLEYPAASQELNSAFAGIAFNLDDKDKPEFGSELYIRMRDVAPLVQAARKLRAVIVTHEDDHQASSLSAKLNEALDRLSDIPENALS